MDISFDNNLETWKKYYNNPENIVKPREVIAWQNKVRKKKIDGKLSEERIQKLEATPGWRWTTPDSFEQTAYEWREMYIKKGSRNPSNTSKDPEEYRLAKWQATCRTNKKLNKMPQDRIDFLESMSEWRWGREDTFFEQFANWKHHKTQGTLNQQEPSAKRAASWVYTMKQYRKKNKLTDEQLNILNAEPLWSW